MYQMQVEFDGWVVINADQRILDWSFDYTRTSCIQEFSKGSKYSWKQWYDRGFRCIKATKTISIA